MDRLTMGEAYWLMKYWSDQPPTHVLLKAFMGGLAGGKKKKQSIVYDGDAAKKMIEEVKDRIRKGTAGALPIPDKPE